MTPLTIRQLVHGDIPEMARLLAARHRGLRRSLPFLRPDPENAPGWEPHLAQALQDPHAEGVVASAAGGSMAGFLVGTRMMLAPEHFASQFIPPQSISVGLEGHCVAEGFDATSVYRELYRTLAGEWVRSGSFLHRVEIPAALVDVQEAWLDLGFGRFLTAATRELSKPAGSAAPASVKVHRAGTEDLEVVMGLAETLNSHHALAPMFWPVLRATEPAAREFNRGELAKGESPYFVGYDESGRPVGMQTFLKPGFSPMLVAGPDDVYLFEGVVEPEVRSGGVGRALMAHSLAWAREQGLQTMTLHWAAGNFSGRPFWEAQGFVPIAHTMSRTVDERVAWARP